MTGPIADTPAAPYYAVIFSSLQTGDTAGYAAMASAMSRLAAEQPGWLGEESAHDGLGITVSYWRDLDSVTAWKAKAEHLAAQQLGRERWYAAYRVRVAKVEREYGYMAP